MECIIDDEKELSAQVGHVAAERFIGIDRYVKPSQVQSIVRCEERLHVGIAVTLHLA